MDKRLEIAISFLELIKKSKNNDSELLKEIASDGLNQIEVCDSEEEILRDLAYGYQSRSAYNKLISRAREIINDKRI